MTSRICKPTFHLRPSPTDLHLPSNQTVTEHMSNTNGLVLVHISTALVSLGQIFWVVGPFVPGCFETSNVFRLLSLLWGMLTFFTICGTKLSVESRLKDSYPQFKTDYGGGLGLYIVGLFFILCAMLGTMSVSGKIERKGPPTPAEGA
ncbi:hypothetical protein I302_102224 [Kwoniella bestiolae CBS 10118]|uniref:MARVEL domain-containing protein n=1 Tax=Kwoniella bestiolae CBS 10118 TaxID=1296100 RepID=A0A1B9GEI5_9TREE|nr:hypothetical protein I302_00914 [Kwoniella bestiolae CBS 10118]OCF29409.1 hypothetical protein I302_00914 [Kwoniella bestiolae CBS 10118]